MLLPELANKIINEVKRLIDEDIIFVDKNGIIIASTDQNRVGAYHQGAEISAQKKESVIITKENQQNLIGVKAGINLPVFFRKEVIGVIGITGEPEKVSPIGEVFRKMIELLISENYYFDQIELHSRSLETFVFEWIQNRERDRDFLNRAELLNINLSVKRQAVMVQLHEYEHVNHRDLYTIFANWKQTAKNDVIVFWGTKKILLLRETNDEENRVQTALSVEKFQSFLQSNLQLSMSIGVGQKVPSQELRFSYKQAERALKAANCQETIVFDEDLTVEILLDEVSKKTKQFFIERTIAPLTAENELLLTLKKWFEMDLSHKKTAAALHIHINTLHYRLKKIHDLTNLNPNHLQDRLTLYISIIILGENTKNSR